MQKEKGKKDTNNKITVAMCYDFDKTLSPKEMQDYTLLPKLGIKDKKKFWEESNNFAKENGMDKILSYMRLILKKKEEKSDEVSILRNNFTEMGGEVELFNGVETWFSRIDEYAKNLEIKIEHYIISAGLKEIIDGTKIARNFEKIFASCYYFDKDGIPKWPLQVVNYTQKTQYLFRISKDCMDLSDEDSINKFIPEEERKIPFRNFIYIGDSATDIPAMKVIAKEKGYAIGVYDPQTRNAEAVCDLLSDKRISFFAPADYKENGILDTYVKKVLDEISARENNLHITEKQKHTTDFLKSINGYFKSEINKSEKAEDLITVVEQIKTIFPIVKKNSEKTYKNPLFDIKGIKKVFEIKQKKLVDECNKKIKELQAKNALPPAGEMNNIIQNTN